MNQAEIKRRQLQMLSCILALVTLTVVARMTGYNGAAYTAGAVEVFAFLWLVIGGSLTESLGRLLRVRNSKGQHKNAKKLRRNTLIFHMAFGLLGSVALLVGADWIARNIFRLQYSTFILMVLSPAVFLRTLSAVLLGYFQGEAYELPTVAAGIMRQIFVLGFSLLFGRMLSEYGNKVSRLLGQENFAAMYGGLGVAIAISVTEVFIVIFLILIYRGSRRRREMPRQEGMRAMDSFVDSLRVLWSARGLQWVTEMLIFLPLPLGLIFLQKTGAENAAVEYGVYLSGYGVLCGSLTALTLISLLPVCGRVAVLLRKEEQRFARTAFLGGVHIGVVHTAFVAVFIAVMAGQLGAVLCPGQEQAAEQMLRGGSLAVGFLALAFYLGRLLILIGGKLQVLGSVGVSVVVYVVVMAALLGVGDMGVVALVYAGVLGQGLLCILLSILVFRQLRVRFDWLQFLVVPVGTAAVTGLVCMLLGRVFTPHLGELVTVIVTLVPGFGLYWALLLLFRNFREPELEVISGGRLIRSVGQMLKVF